MKAVFIFWEEACIQFSINGDNPEYCLFSTKLMSITLGLLTD